MKYKVDYKKSVFIVIFLIILIILYISFGKRPMYYTYNANIYNYNNGESLGTCKVVIRGYASKYVFPNNTNRIAMFMGTIKIGDTKLEKCDFYILNNNWMLLVQSIPKGSMIYSKEIGEVFIGDNFNNIKLLIKKDITYKNVNYNALLIESIIP